MLSYIRAKFGKVTKNRNLAREYDVGMLFCRSSAFVCKCQLKHS